MGVAAVRFVRMAVFSVDYDYLTGSEAVFSVFWCLYDRKRLNLQA